ncbi:hypothetical protein C8R45DRAFT_1019443 [Mycena sanguinolenta]|nr:hypothetical protein C8R45DRAFT_1019443 [Mycena sanguinolenta]
MAELGMHNAIPPDACVDLWRRVWPWMEFLDEYGESLVSNDFLPLQQRYSACLLLIHFLHGTQAATRIIGTTPGLYVVVGKAWRHALARREQRPLADVSYVLGLWFERTVWDSAAFEELVTGTGGTLTDLASVVVSHLKRVLPEPDSPVTDQTIVHLAGITCIVGSQVLTGHKDNTFQDALISRGIVATLTQALRALCRSTVDGAATIVKGLFPALVDQISSFLPVWLPRSLDAGLLDIVFTSEHREAVSRALVALLNNVLCPATVYRSVLAQLRTSFAQVRDRDAAAIFHDAALLAHWESFVALVEGRLWILDQYDTGALTVPRACDNLECAKIRPKHELKRCSGCLTAYYCLRTCQSNDWRHGGHRHTCGNLALRRTKFSHISSSDRSFLRTLVHYECTTKRDEVAPKQRFFDQRHPGEVPYIMLDFLTGMCDIEIGSLRDLGSDYTFEVERAERSGREMQLHVMKVLDGIREDYVCSRVWSFPLRFSACAPREFAGNT